MTAITIIGTGLAGLTAALAVAHTGVDVTLVGEAPPTKPGVKNDGRTTAVLSPGVDYLKKLNLWVPCAAKAIPLMTMELIDRDTGFVFDASETNLNEFGFNVPNDILRTTLTQAVGKNKKITWIKENVSHAARRHDRWTLTLANNKKIQSTLVIAADGRNSMMRRAAGIETDQRDENQTALVMTVEAEKPHHYTSVEWYRAGGPLTLVPMQGKKLAVVWCEDDATAQDKKKSSPAALARELTEMTDSRFGALTVTDTPQSWPIHPMKARRLVKDNVILIGEAAHVMPPIGAQGFNASLQDIIALTACFDKAQRLGLPPSDAALLAQYETIRLKDIALRYQSMTRLNDLIRTSHPALSFLRGVGLRSMQRFAPLKKRVMAFGLGYKDNAA